jgi:hypothetical protein
VKTTRGRASDGGKCGKYEHDKDLGTRNVAVTDASRRLIAERNILSSTELSPGPTMGFFNYSEGVDARYGIFIDKSHATIDSNLGKKFNYPSHC